MAERPAGRRLDNGPAARVGLVPRPAEDAARLRLATGMFTGGYELGPAGITIIASR